MHSWTLGLSSLAPTIRNSAKALILRGQSVLLQECVYEGLHVYFLPGGGQEFGEPLEDTLRREVREETGMSVRVDRLLWVREFVERNHLPVEGYGGHIVEFVYRCTPEDGAEPGLGPVPDAAQVGTRWVPLRELPGITMRPEAVRQLLVAWDQEGIELTPGYLGDYL